MSLPDSPEVEELDLGPNSNDLLAIPVVGRQGEPGPPANVGNVQELIDTAVAAHAQATEPHPAYDEMPSLRLVFENGLI